MKKIDTGFISGTAGMPIKSGVLNHLFQAYQEAITAICQSLVGDFAYSSAQVYIIAGCLESGSGLAHSISAGWVYFNNEVYQVDAVSFLSPSGEVAVGDIVTTFATAANADPVGFTDGSSHNVLQIRKVVISSALTGAGTLPDFTEWNRVSSSALYVQLVAAYGITYTMRFVQDQAIFFTAAPPAGAYSLNFDMANAIPGTVIRLKINSPSGSTATVNTPGGTTLLNLGGAITPNKINLVTCEYMGKNELGNDEVQYSVVSI